MTARILPLLGLALLLASCGGEDVAPSTGSSSSSGGTTAPPVKLVGKLSDGKTAFQAECSACHGNFNGPVSDGQNKIIASNSIRFDNSGGAITKEGKRYQSLDDYISAEMPPKKAAVKCTGQCAADIAVYLRSVGSVKATALECDTNDPILYGTRTLRLLNSHEYQNSVEDLLGIQQDYGKKVSSSDGYLGGFVSMASRVVNDQLADAYMSNAEEIAAWAVKNNKPFTCGDANACANRFISETAFRAFRRPLTTQESSEYTSLFTRFGSINGMELALTTLLTSPQFLYRDETGVDTATAILKGYYDGAGAANTIEAEEYDGGSPIAPFTAQNEGGRTVMVWPGTGGANADAGDNTEGQLYYTTVATETTMKLFATVNFPSANDDSFHYKLEGKDNAWGLMNAVSTAGFEEIEVGAWTGLTVGRTYTLKIQRREDGAQLDAFRIQGGEFGKAAQSNTPGINLVEMADANAYVLSPYEFASALAFMFTGSLPDLELLQAARKDELTTQEQIGSHVDRMINSTRGKAHFSHFVGTWLQTDQVTTVNRNAPDFTQEVKNAMAEEVKAFFRHIFYDDGAPFKDFYAADYTFVNKALADFYGAQGNFDNSFKMAQIPGRGGITTAGAFMASNAHANRSAPILRAVDIRELMLCHHIEAPDSALDANRDAAQKLVEEYERQHGGVDSRSFFELYTEDSACEACHKRIINPLFGIEDFDNVGRLRKTSGSGFAIETLENGKEIEVNLAGTLYGVESTNSTDQINFVGAKDLGKKLANTEAIQKCLVKKGFRFITGLPVSHHDYDKAEPVTLTEDQEEDHACAISQMTSAFKGSNESPRAMFKQLGSLELLRFRK